MCQQQAGVLGQSVAEGWAVRTRCDQRRPHKPGSQQAIVCLLCCQGHQAAWLKLAPSQIKPWDLAPGSSHKNQPKELAPGLYTVQV